MATPAKKPDLTKLTPEQLKQHQALVEKLQKETSAYRDEKTKEREAIYRAELASRTGSGGVANYGSTITQGKADYVFVDDKLAPEAVSHVPLPPGQVWHVCLTSQDFEAYLAQYGVPKHVSFDSNLGLESKGDGASCARYLKTFCHQKSLPLPEWTAHSATLTGQQAIQQVMDTK